MRLGKVARSVKQFMHGVESKVSKTTCRKKQVCPPLAIIGIFEMVYPREKVQDIKGTEQELRYLYEN